MNKDFEIVNTRNYIKFILPTIFSMVFISIYSMTDGIFVSNRLGSTALAALNITLPAFNFIFGSIFMIVIGASAIIGINLGANQRDQANKNFSNMLYLLGFITFVYIIIGMFFTKSIAMALGARGELITYASDYLFILFIASFGLVTELFTGVFLRIEGKFKLSLIGTLVGGLSNILFNYIFHYLFDMGIQGAALGTVLGSFINGLFGIIYFLSKHSMIHLEWAPVNLAFLKDALVNGSSEMVSSISNGVTTFLFNMVLLKSVGNIGVSSISIILYVNFLLSSIFIGIAMGIQPLVSYNYGAMLTHNINKLLKISCTLIGVISILAFAICHIFKYQLIGLFDSNNPELLSMTAHAFTIFSFTFFISGYNILGSGFFTALNNGKYSAIISFGRSIILKSIIILSLPNIIGLDGVWLTTPLSEYLCILITVYFYRKVKRTHLITH